MRACACVRLVRAGQPEGSVELGHGALIGRIATAALQVDDQRISEAHAMVSLRSGGLRLLALRRRFAVAGEPTSDVALRAGLEITLVDGIVLQVESVTLPPAVIGLVWPGGEAALLHDTAAILGGSDPTVVWRPMPDAAVQLWRVGESWRYVRGDQRPATLAVGDRIEVDGVAFHAALIPIQGAEPTRGPLQPLHLVAYYDTVHILRAGHAPFVIAGGGARMISELALARAPIAWVPLARTLWRDDEPDHVLRGRLDAVLRRLRAKLAAGGLREDLVAPDGLGHLELRLAADDHVEDRT